MTQSPSESGENRLNTDLSPSAYLETIQDVQQQQIDLKVDVERIHQEVERFRIFFQTLVSGLVLALVVAFGIAIWFAYRSFSQQQIARQNVEAMTAMQEDLMTQVDQLEGRLQRLERRSDEMAVVTDDIESGQAELRRLRDRLNEIEVQLETLDLDTTTPLEETVN